MEENDLLLDSEVTIEVYFHCASDFLNLKFGPYPKGVEKDSTAIYNWYSFPWVWVRASTLCVDLSFIQKALDMFELSPMGTLGLSPSPGYNPDVRTV